MLNQINQRQKDKFFEMLSKTMVPLEGLPDQHCLRIGGQAGLPDLVFILFNIGQAGTGAE